MMQAAGTLRESAVREVVKDRKLRRGVGILAFVLTTVLAVAVLPFLLGDLIKVLIALLLLERIKSTSLGRF